MRRCPSLLFALVLAANVATAQRKPFTPGDLSLWRSITEARISPDGTRAVYVETGGAAANAESSNLWIASTDGRQHSALTTGPHRDSMPRWSADSARVAYISDRKGSPQIFIRSIGAAEDKQVTQEARAPLALGWSPDGRFIVFTARVPAQVSAPWAPRDILPLLVHSIESHIQLFIVPASGGASRELTSGDLNWTGEPAWLADGSAIICEGRPEPDPAHPLEGGQIFSIRPSDGAMKQLTEQDGLATNPVPSPDGSRIAWLGSAAAPQSYTLRRLFVMNPDGARVRMLTGAFDRDVTSPQWSSDSRTVYFLAEDHGASHVYAARHDGTLRQVTKGPERLRDFSLADNGRAAAIRSSATEGGNLISFAADLPGGVAALDAPNEHLLAERQIGAVEELSYSSSGATIQGWLIEPPSFDDKKKYPLLINIRDNPRAMIGYEFQLRAQIFAAAGYLVLLANPRGAPGYGEQFGSLLRTRYPGDDAADIVSGIEYVLSKGHADPGRVSIVGGVVAAWMIGHTERLRSAVLRRPVADWLTDVAFAPDGLHRAAAWMGAMPWDDPDQYVKHSPVYFAGNFKTPTLLISSQKDPESRELYFALQARKVDSAWVRLSEATNIAQRILELEAEIAWLGRN